MVAPQRRQISIYGNDRLLRVPKPACRKLAAMKWVILGSAATPNARIVS